MHEHVGRIGSIQRPRAVSESRRAPSSSSFNIKGAFLGFDMISIYRELGKVLFQIDLKRKESECVEEEIREIRAYMSGSKSIDNEFDESQRLLQMSIQAANEARNRKEALLAEIQKLEL
jgi:hypothetical protein